MISTLVPIILLLFMCRIVWKQYCNKTKDVVHCRYNVHTLSKALYEQDIHRFKGTVSIILRAILQ